MFPSNVAHGSPLQFCRSRLWLVPGMPNDPDDELCLCCLRAPAFET